MPLPLFNLHDVFVSFQVTYSTDVLSPVLQAAVDSLACILSCHGRSCIQLVSDLRTELINQDAHRTNPFEVKTSKPGAIENLINQASKNAPMELACSSPTKQTYTTLEGFCSHNDVSSGTSDPTGKNTETGLACSIQSAHLNND